MPRSAAAILVVLIALAALPAYQHFAGGKEAPPVRVGAPDGLESVLVQYAVRKAGIAGTVSTTDYDVLSVKDCCASPAQWALSAEELDIALICPDAAAELLAKDSRYEVAGDCLANSVMVVERQPGPRQVGVAQGRSYQDALVAGRYGPDCAVMHILEAGLPYALEKQTIDAAIIDVLKGWPLTGIKRSAADGRDVVTAVVVVRKAFTADPRYGAWTRALAEAAQELNRPEILREELKRTKNIDFSEEDLSQWNRLRTKFLSTTTATRG